MSANQGIETWQGATPVAQIIAQERRKEFFDGLQTGPHLQVDGLETLQKLRPDLMIPLAQREEFDDLGVAQSLLAVIRGGNCAFGLAQAHGRHVRTADTFFVTALSEESRTNNAEFMGRLRPGGAVLLGGQVTIPTGEEESCPRFALCMDRGYNVTVQRRLDVVRPMRLPFEVVTAGFGYNKGDRAQYLLGFDNRTWTCTPGFLAERGIVAKRALHAEAAYRAKRNIIKPPDEEY